MEEDPFTVPLEEKVALLMEGTRRMQTVPGVTFAEGGLDLFRRSTWFASSDGAAIDQVVVHSGGGLEATAIADGDVQRRSYPNSFRGHIKAAGWEHVRTLGLIEESERTGREAVELLSAPECPSEVTTLILDSGQVELQVHESIGHPIELDRVLGMEEAYAGSSFLTIEDRGTLKYGSPLVSVTADATLSGGLGSFGYDDEGVPAQRVPILVDGIFQNFLTSRETAPVVGQASNGTSRADGWSHLPLIRMTNISLEPREGSLAEIIGDTKDGIFMATNQSWSIDDKRINFQFGCEIAWRVKDGKLTQMLQEPQLHGDHAGVLGIVRRRRRPRGVDRVGHAELRQGPARPGRPRGTRHVAGALPRRPGRGALMPGLIGEDRFRAVAEAALDLTGVDGVEVLYTHEWGGLTRFANSVIHQSTFREDTGLRVRVVSRNRTRRRLVQRLQRTRGARGGRERQGDGRGRARPTRSSPAWPRRPPSPRSIASSRTRPTPRRPRAPRRSRG